MIGNSYLKLKLLKRKIPFKALYSYKGTRKVEYFQILCNKEIYFTLQSNSTKWYKKPFKFISCSNFLEGHHILSQESFDRHICSISYTLIHFSLPLILAIHRMGNAPKILCPRCRERAESQPHFISFCKLSRFTLDFISELINLSYSFNIPFKISLKTTTELLLNSMMVYSYSHLAQRYCFWIGLLVKRNRCQRLELHFKQYWKP